MPDLRLLGISGSLRRDSSTTVLLHACRELAPDDVEVQVLRLDGIPLFDRDVDLRGVGERDRPGSRGKDSPLDHTPTALPLPVFGRYELGVLREPQRPNEVSPSAVPPSPPR